MSDTRAELLTLLDYVWARFHDRMLGLTDDEWRWQPVPDERITLRWRFEHLDWLLRAERNATWLGLEPPAPEGRIGDDAAADLIELDAAYAQWRTLVGQMTEATLATPMGEIAGQWAASTRREFVLHVADELVHHTAECALLRDLFAGRSA